MAIDSAKIPDVARASLVPDFFVVRGLDITPHGRSQLWRPIPPPPIGIELRGNLLVSWVSVSKPRSV
jgi:hypothetical protein